MYCFYFIRQCNELPLFSSLFHYGWKPIQHRLAFSRKLQRSRNQVVMECDHVECLLSVCFYFLSFFCHFDRREWSLYRGLNITAVFDLLLSCNYQWRMLIKEAGTICAFLQSDDSLPHPPPNSLHSAAGLLGLHKFPEQENIVFKKICAFLQFPVICWNVIIDY